MKDPTGACRVLLCTIAFGMGVDIQDGPSSDVDDYLQEAGRAGRDGFSSNAVLYCYPGCTLGLVSPAMTKYTVSDQTCRRSLLLQSFAEDHDVSQLHHSCCDIRTQQCSCANPCLYQPVHAEQPATTHSTEDEDNLPPEPVRSPTTEQLQQL